MTEALKLLAQRLKNPVYDGEPQWLPDSGKISASIISTWRTLAPGGRR